MEGKIHSRMATADANVLAGGGGVGNAGSADDRTQAGRVGEKDADKDADEISRDEL